MRALAADGLLVVHLLLVAFNVGGLLVTWVGAALGWPWVRARPFRLLHLVAIGMVAAGALLGAACPLTVWEDALRGAASPASFVARWVSRVLYYDLPGSVFSVLYVAWAAATLVTWRLVPPRAVTSEPARAAVPR
jgi:Protein of Unknown function (DUF2784)